jgi:3'-5' exonuclease
MLDFLDISKVLFLDIETVPAYAQYSDLDDTWKTLWKHKARSILKKQMDEEVTDEDASSVYDRAGIYAEFGKIICISVGIFAYDKETQLPYTKLKSFAHDDETELLRGFIELLNKSFNMPDRHFLCGHNIKEFDIPFICRRIVSHQMALPSLLNIAGKKPWETKHLVDTMELWKFGDNKSYTSVKLLAAVFGFPSPKDDIDGSEVAGVYYNDKDLDRIARYCEKDVVAVMQLILKFKRMPLHLTIDGKIVSA